MAEVKTPVKKEAIDPWTTDKSTWVYVAIPEENGLGIRHDSISNNNHIFEAGKTYLVPSVVAEDVKDRLRVYARACVRTLQPRRDYAAENAVAVGSASSANSVEPSTLG